MTGPEALEYYNNAQFHTDSAKCSLESMVSPNCDLSGAAWEERLGNVELHLERALAALRRLAGKTGYG